MESKHKKIQNAKNEIISLSNRTIPVECDRIVILTSSGNYQKALEEVQQIKENIKLLENSLKDILSNE